MDDAPLIFMALSIGSGFLAAIMPNPVVWFRDLISRRWTIAEAKVFTSTITCSRSWSRDHQMDYQLAVTYTYKAEGCPQFGDYRQTFSDELGAKQLLSSLEQGPMYIRFNPKRPWRSYLNPYRDVRLVP